MEKIYLYGGKCVLKKCWTKQDVEKAKLNNTLKHVQVIGENAFMSNWNLKGTLYIPSNVTVIEKRAFAYCKNLTDVIIAGNNVEIKEWAFEGCVNLQRVNFECAKKIGPHAFHGCEKLQARRLKPDARIGAGVFDGVESMKGVDLPGDFIRDTADRYAEPIIVEEPKTDAELLSYIQKMMTGSFLNPENQARANNMLAQMLEDAKHDEEEIKQAKLDEDYIPQFKIKR